MSAELVLVVDDEPTVREVVSRYLELGGYRVVVAADGHAALELALASHGPPDLVVLDLMLPGMDGLEVCRRIRAAAAVPIVMLTARGHETDRIVGLELGADDYVVKPFSPRRAGRKGPQCPAPHPGGWRPLRRAGWPACGRPHHQLGDQGRDDRRPSGRTDRA